MRKNLTEIVFILDRSGSMSGLEADTIGGYNSLLEKQQKDNGEAIVSTVLFDDMQEVLHDRVKLSEIKPMTDRDYTVRGCTALIDAIGGAIHADMGTDKGIPAELTSFEKTTDSITKSSLFSLFFRVGLVIKGLTTKSLRRLAPAIPSAKITVALISWS